MKRITQKWLRHYKAAAYGRSYLETVVGHKGLWLKDFLALSSVSIDDKLWVATQAPDVITRRWLGKVLRRALARVTEPDPRSVAVLEYLDRGGRIPKRIAEEAEDASDTFPFNNRAYDAVFTASCLSFCRGDAASGVVDLALLEARRAASEEAGLQEWERKQQVRDLLDLLGKEEQ
jgi:hypothetical protein